MSSASSRLKKLAAEIPSGFTTEATIQTLIEQDTFLADTAIVLLATQMLDKALQTALVAKMCPQTNTERAKLFDYDKRGSLCDFSAKIKVGYAFELYGSRTRDDLEAIRAIRNLFAHPEQHYDFEEDGEIASIANGLFLLQTITLLGAPFGQHNAKAKFATVCGTIAQRLKDNITPRGKFQTLAEVLMKPSLP